MKIIISGYSGRMGQVLKEAVLESAEFQLAAGFDIADCDDAGTPIFSAQNLSKAPKSDVVIDFSNYKFTPALLAYCEETKIPLVLATTALGENELALAKKAAESIPVFRSANMSLGINLIAKLVGLAMPAFEKDFDIEIIEKHHNQKKDAPSGTALLLADAINAAAQDKKTYIYGRQGKEAAQKHSEIGIHAVRGGTLPGEHTLIFAGEDEVIEIKHEVFSRKVFANGALAAARFIADKPAGLYDMQALLNA